MSFHTSCIASPWHQWLCTYFGIALDCQWPIWKALYWNTRENQVCEILFESMVCMPKPTAPGWSFWSQGDNIRARDWWDARDTFFEIHLRKHRSALNIRMEIDDQPGLLCTVSCDGYLTLTQYEPFGDTLASHRAPLKQGLAQLERVWASFCSIAEKSK
jgi:hypothetical protein